MGYGIYVSLLTCEPRSAQTQEPANLVHTSGSILARLGDALVHLDLTQRPLEARDTEASRPIPTTPTDGPITAGVRGALVKRSLTLEPREARLTGTAVTSLGTWAR